MKQEIPEVLRHLNGKLEIDYLIGQGAFGQVYAASHQTYKKKLAVKIEWRETNENSNGEGFSMLLREAKILMALRNKPGYPSVKEFKSASQFHYLVMDRLGPNVNSLLKYCGQKFSLKTSLMIFDQAVVRLQTLHETGFLHRDVKPDNLVVGNEQSQDQVYLIDFGISKPYKNRDGIHLAMKQRSGMIGTARFASIAAHNKMEQGRKDDLESLGYSMVYLASGYLPWLSLETTETEERIEEIKKLKEKIDLNLLCEGLPDEFKVYFEYVKGLNFCESPSYTHIRKLIWKMFSDKDYAFDYVYDWVDEKDGDLILPYHFEHIKSNMIYSKSPEAPSYFEHPLLKTDQLDKSHVNCSRRLKVASFRTLKPLTIKLSSQRPQNHNSIFQSTSKKPSIGNTRSINDTNKTKGTVGLVAGENLGVAVGGKFTLQSHLSKEIGPFISFLNKQITTSKSSATDGLSPQVKILEAKCPPDLDLNIADPAECWSVDEENDVEKKLKSLSAYKTIATVKTELQRSVKPPSLFSKIKK